MHHRTLLAIVTLAGLAALLSSCGDSSSAKNASAAQPTPVPTLSDQAFQAAANAVADSVMLKLDDLPAGWKSEGHVPDNSLVGFTGECELFNRDNPLTGSAFSKASDDFSDPNDNDAALQVDVFRSAVEAQDGLNRLADLIARCQDQFTDIIKSQIQADGGSDVYNIQSTFRDLRIGGLGDDTHAYRIAISFTFARTGITVPFTEDIILVRTGVIVSDVFATLEGTGGTFAADLARTVATRMASANAFLPQ
jgi:hypothetical protein